MQHRCLVRSLSTAALALVAVTAALAAPPPALAAPLVFIDAGHGGPYSNANVNGLLEKNVNLAVALELQRQLGRLGYRTRVDRTGDTAVGTRDIPTWHWASDGPHLYADGIVSSGVPIDDLQARANLANAAGADLFVSIHCNGVESSGPNGTETFASTADVLGQRLSRIVQQEMIAEVGLTDRGAKQQDFYVIRWANMPACLVETGFLSNPAEAAKLASPIFRMRLARGLARGIDRFLASAPFTPLYPRLAGADRFDTAAKVSKAGWPGGTRTVLLASGVTWPDAVAAAPLSRKLDAPLLLTSPTALPASTRAELTRLHPRQVVVLGGASSVATSVADEATRAATVGTATVTAQRIGGADRYQTARLIAEAVGLPADGRIALVSGASFPDALTLSPYAGRWRIPVLLADGAELPAATRDYIAARRSSIRRVLVMGSESGVRSSAVRGLPGLTRVSGGDRWTTNVALLRIWGTGTLTPLVVSGLDFPDGLVAGAYGAKSARPVVLVGPRLLPDRTREFVAQTAGRTSGFTIVGSGNAVPPIMEWELRKAQD